MCNTGAKISRSARPICFFVAKYYYIHSYFGGVGHVPQERVVARRVRPDKRWDAGVGAGDGHPGSIARKGRSLVVDQPSASPGERHDMTHDGGQSQAEDRLGKAAAILMISRRRKAKYGGIFWNLM
jgi:hypothetical protein